ncbi:MAG: Ig-like domain-containing protein [Isosphaeraceae bacterium]
MDRRRYVPSAEFMEGRLLLSTVTAAGRPAASVAPQSVAAASLSFSNAGSNLPESYSQKLKRIENLPYFLEQLQPGRYLPAETIRSIQDDLLALTAKLHGPPAERIDHFNVQLRETLASASLSAQNAHALNVAFGQVLEGAGVTSALLARFKADMNQLALVDSQSPNPTYLASNDYAVILQTALAVGRPIVTPRAPRLSPTDGQSVGNGAGGVSTDPTPTLVGSYEAGASDGGTTRIEILDGDGEVLGSGPVGSDGRYSVTLERHLGVGQHTLNARAVDVVGNQSKLSPGLILRVVSRPARPVAAAQFLAHPGGPLRLR